MIIGGAFFWAGHIPLIQWVMSQINALFQLSFLQSIVTAIIVIFMVPLEMPAPADFLPMLPQLAFTELSQLVSAFTLQLVAQRYTTAAAAALILSLESVFAAFLAGGCFQCRQFSSHYSVVV